MEIAYQNLQEEILRTLTPIIGKKFTKQEIIIANMNLYGFVKALIKAKLENDGYGDGDENARSRREI